MTKEEFFNKLPPIFANDDFYHLCKAFIDLALNSEKFKTQNGHIMAKFYLDDIKTVKALANSYLKKYKVNKDKLRKMIELHAHDSVEDEDKRQKAYFDNEAAKDSKPVYYAGTLYIFTEIPNNVMDEIFKDLPN